MPIDSKIRTGTAIIGYVYLHMAAINVLQLHMSFPTYYES